MTVVSAVLGADPLGRDVLSQMIYGVPATTGPAAASQEPT
jgi:ABC-type dipeptide/oligopeptide/nickel transport system permease subunit